MTPSEIKAKELVEKFKKPTDAMGNYPMCYDTAKQCAIICVEEILKNIEATKIYHPESNALPFNEEFWQEVLNHLTK